MDNIAGAIECLVRPRSIAIVGASDDFTKMGGRPIKYLLKHGYRGKIIPINPKYKEIAGFPCYPRVSDVPGDVDQAMLIVANRLVFDVLDECAAKGVKAATIFSAGFAEAGGEGKAAQQRLRDFARERGVRLCGPNCIGVVNVNDGIFASFSLVGEKPSLLPGKIGLISQSGSLAGSLVAGAQDRGIGFAYFISSGNEADLEASDFIRYMIKDPAISVVAAVIEGFRDGAKFKEVAEEALAAKKPLVVLKLGRYAKGRAASASHTAAMAGSAEAHRALFRQKGVISVGDIDELLDVALILASCPVPAGDGLGLVTHSGGTAVLSADKGEELGVKFPELSERTKVELKKAAPLASMLNPCDFTAQQINDPSILKLALNLYFDDANIDMVVFAMTTIPTPEMRVLEYAMEALQDNPNKKPLALLFSSTQLNDPFFAPFKQAGIPVYNSIERCLKAMRALGEYGNILRRQQQLQAPGAWPAKGPVNSKAVSELLADKQGALTEFESKRLLALYGVPVTKEALAATEQQAAAIAQETGYPVALKVQSRQILHKTEAKAIRLGLHTEAELLQAYRELLAQMAARPEAVEVQGILVQEMVEGGTEVIVGTSLDSQFGPQVLFGLGGIFVEMLQDVSLRIAPLSKLDAEAMLGEIRGGKILQGVRGRAPADCGAIRDVILRLSQLALDLQDRVAEIDINPLIALREGQGAKAVDARVILR